MVAQGVYIVYYGLHLLALVTLPTLTITLIWPKRSTPNRHPILPVNTGFWACYALSSLLLLFTNSFSGPQPARLTCYVQSAFVLASGPAVASAALSLVVTVWMHAWFVESERTFHVTQRKTKLMLIVLPFLTFLSFLISGLIIGSRTSVSRAIFYCLLDYPPLVILSGATSGVLLLSTATFQVWTIVIVYRRFVGSRRIGATEIGDMEAATFFRVLIFGLYIFVGLIICFISIKSPTQLATDLITAAIGPTIFVTFATEDSVLRAWRLKAPLPVQSRSDSTVTMNQARRQSIYPSPQIISNESPSSIARVLASFNFPNRPTPSTVQATASQSLTPQPVVPFVPSTVPLIREPPDSVGFLLTSELYLALESPTTPTEPHYTTSHHFPIPQSFVSSPQLSESHCHQPHFNHRSWEISSPS